MMKFPANHVDHLRELREMAMTAARVARALRDRELVERNIRDARVASHLIVNARQHGAR
jgi:hypothetical protein